MSADAPQLRHKAAEKPIFAHFVVTWYNCSYDKSVTLTYRKSQTKKTRAKLANPGKYWQSIAQHSFLTQGSIPNHLIHLTRRIAGNCFISYLPWNQSLQISHSIINRLTSYGCRQTQYSWAVAIFGLSPNNTAKLRAGRRFLVIMRKQHREERNCDVPGLWACSVTSRVNKNSKHATAFPWESKCVVIHSLRFLGTFCIHKCKLSNSKPFFSLLKRKLYLHLH